MIGIIQHALYCALGTVVEHSVSWCIDILAEVMVANVGSFVQSVYFRSIPWLLLRIVQIRL